MQKMTLLFLLILIFGCSNDGNNYSNNIEILNKVDFYQFKGKKIILRNKNSSSLNFLVFGAEISESCKQPLYIHFDIQSKKIRLDQEDSCNIDLLGLEKQINLFNDLGIRYLSVDKCINVLIGIERNDGPDLIKYNDADKSCGLVEIKSMRELKNGWYVNN